MNKIDVLYTVDKNYAKYMLISLYSLIESNQDLDINIHIVYDNLEDEDFKRINYIKNMFSNCSIYYYDYSKFASDIAKLNIPTWRNSRISNARVFFSRILPFCDNLLYLDSDTMVINSVKGLENYNETVNMVKDSMPTTHWKNLGINLQNYFNSGVIWINGKKWIKNDYDLKILDVLKRGVRLEFSDQDLLNIALNDSIGILPPNYDFFPIDDYLNSYLLDRYNRFNNIIRYNKEEMKEAKKNPIILHATPFFGYRTWDNDSIHPFNKYYEEYCSKVFGHVVREDNCDINSINYKLCLCKSLVLPYDTRQKIKKILKK